MGSIFSHQATQAHILYMLECMTSTIFNWSEGLLVRLKDHLTKRQQGELKQFGYGAVVVSFFLERVPLNRLEPKDPWIFRLVEAMAHHGGVGGLTVTYRSIFLHWL